LSKWPPDRRRRLNDLCRDAGSKPFINLSLKNPDHKYSASFKAISGLEFNRRFNILLIQKN